MSCRTNRTRFYSSTQPSAQALTSSTVSVASNVKDHNVKQLARMSMYAKCIGGCMQGDSVGSNPRLSRKKGEEMKY